jgi:hypothetical protein
MVTKILNTIILDQAGNLIENLKSGANIVAVICDKVMVPKTASRRIENDPRSSFKEIDGRQREVRLW